MKEFFGFTSIVIFLVCCLLFVILHHIFFLLNKKYGKKKISHTRIRRKIANEVPSSIGLRKFINRPEYVLVFETDNGKLKKFVVNKYQFFDAADEVWGTLTYKYKYYMRFDPDEI